MGIVIGVTATGLTFLFCYYFCYLWFNRHTLHKRDYKPRHRDPENRRVPHIIVKRMPDELITTGDIYGAGRETSQATPLW